LTLGEVERIPCGAPRTRARTSIRAAQPILPPPTAGDGPRVELVGHLNWWSTFSVPGDETTESTTAHGLDTRLEAPDGGIIAIIAGRTDPEGAHSGVARFVDDPAIAEAICAALTPWQFAARRRSRPTHRQAPASDLPDTK
jgi:hypothetical protein